MKWIVKVIDGRNEDYRMLYEGDIPDPGDRIMLETKTLTGCCDVDLTRYDIVSVGLISEAVIVFCHRKGL